MSPPINIIYDLRKFQTENKEGFPRECDSWNSKDALSNFYRHSKCDVSLKISVIAVSNYTPPGPSPQFIPPPLGGIFLNLADTSLGRPVTTVYILLIPCPF